MEATMRGWSAPTGRGLGGGSGAAKTKGASKKIAAGQSHKRWVAADSLDRDGIAMVSDEKAGIAAQGVNQNIGRMLLATAAQVDRPNIRYMVVLDDKKTIKQVHGGIAMGDNQPELLAKGGERG